MIRSRSLDVYVCIYEHVCWGCYIRHWTDSAFVRTLSCHEGICHPAAEKMYLTIRTKFYWPGLFTDTYEWAKSCPACQKGKDSLHLRAPLKPLPVEGLFKRWNIDHLCMPRSGEYNFVLLAVDSFSLFQF